MKIGKCLSMTLVVVGCIAVFAAVANAGIITLNPTSGNQTLYSYNALNDVGGVQLASDAAENYAFGWAGNSSEGELFTWENNFPSNVVYHLQATPGNTIASDVAVKWRVGLFDWADNVPTNSSFNLDWSTNHTDWTSFASSAPNPGWNVDRTETTALAASGFAGGTDLYVRFTAQQGPGETAYLFQTNSAATANLVVTGTVTATPEPSAIVLIGTGLFGLLAYAWRKRK
jgi:hypothetical protein